MAQNTLYVKRILHDGYLPTEPVSPLAVEKRVSELSASARIDARSETMGYFLISHGLRPPAYVVESSTGRGTSPSILCIRRVIDRQCQKLVEWSNWIANSESPVEGLCPDYERRRPCHLLALTLSTRCISAWLRSSRRSGGALSCLRSSLTINCTRCCRSRWAGRTPISINLLYRAHRKASTTASRVQRTIISTRMTGESAWPTSRRKRAPPLSTSTISATPGGVRSPLSVSNPPRKGSCRTPGVSMGSGPALLKTWAASAAMPTFWKRGGTGAIRSIGRCASGLGSILSRNCFRCRRSTPRWLSSSPFLSSHKI